MCVIPFLNSLQDLQVQLLLPGSLQLLMQSTMQLMRPKQIPTIEYLCGMQNPAATYTLSILQQ